MPQTNQVRIRLNWLAFCSLVATLISGPAVGIAWSQNDIGLIEPGAATWQTWVLQSASALRIPAPPEMSETLAIDLQIQARFTCELPMTVTLRSLLLPETKLSEPDES